MKKFILNVLFSLSALPLMAQTPKASKAHKQEAPPVMLAQLQQMYMNDQGPAATPCAPVITSGLIAWWTMDSQAGGVAADVIGGQNLTIQNHVPALTPGVISNCYNFNSVVLDSWCESAGNLVTGSSARTTMLWFQVPTIFSGNTMEAFGYGQGGANQRWGMFYDYSVTPGILYLEMAGNAIGFNYVNDGKTHHWAVSFTGGAFSATNPLLYLDGVVQIPSVTTTTTPNTINQHIGIAVVPDAGVDQFFGYIDDVRCYNRALSGTEIVQIYTNGKLGLPLNGEGCP